MKNVTFSGNKADNGGGMIGYFSSPTLNNVTFSGNRANEKGGGMYPLGYFCTHPWGNRANEKGGGMYQYHGAIGLVGASSTLINVTFRGNEANKGGGMFDTSSTSTLVNTILWDNTNGNIFKVNTSKTNIELYHSLIEGGINASTNAIGIRLLKTNAVSINNAAVIANDPELGKLADYGGEVDTISINDNSPAKDKGVYVRGVKVGNAYPVGNFYYSRNNTDWYRDPSLETPDTPPNDADDLTATDARGYNRVGRPDMGAYEKLNTQ